MVRCLILLLVLAPTSIHCTHGNGGQEHPVQEESVVVDPRVRHQVFEGWGTSLAWFANVTGAWSADRFNHLVDLIFNPPDAHPPGLGFTRARYNIGGGDNPEHTHLWLGRAMQGFQDADGSWHWDRDPYQRRWLLAARDRGVTIFEAFANSPPYWMTVSQCSAGNGPADHATNNIRQDLCIGCAGYYSQSNGDGDISFHDAFARYLVDVVKHFRDDVGYGQLRFSVLSPANEPLGPWWSELNGQEGAHWDVDQQRVLYNAVAQRLEQSGLATRLAAPEEFSVNDAITELAAFEPTWTESHIGQVNVHTYGGWRRVELRELAARSGHAVHVSEFGTPGEPGHDHQSMTGALALAERIVGDLSGLQARSWSYWQVIEEERDNNWGLIHASFREDSNTGANPEQINMTKQYFGMAQFSRFVRPGMRVIGVDDEHTLAAWDETAQTVVVVTYNNTGDHLKRTFDLSRFTGLGSSARCHRTRSRQGDEGEDLQRLDDPTVTDKRLGLMVPPRSITTCVVKGARLAGEPILVIANTDDRGIRNLRLMLRYTTGGQVWEAREEAAELDQQIEMELVPGNEDGLNTTRVAKGPGAILVIPRDATPLEDVTVTLEFDVGGARHRATHALETWNQPRVVQLAAYWGTESNGVMEGTFLRELAMASSGEGRMP